MSIFEIVATVILATLGTITAIYVIFFATRDYRLVRHGHWVRSNPLTDTEECSRCGYNIIREEMETPYCPWCGTKMDEVAE